MLALAAASSIEDRWNLASSAHWYDLSVKILADTNYLRRVAGHMETGLPSLSDPALGRLG
jgi:phospholipase C